jgi:hypothetical protein
VYHAQIEVNNFISRKRREGKGREGKGREGKGNVTARQHSPQERRILYKKGILLNAYQ